MDKAKTYKDNLYMIMMAVKVNPPILNQIASKNI